MDMRPKLEQLIRQLAPHTRGHGREILATVLSAEGDPFAALAREWRRRPPVGDRGSTMGWVLGRLHDQRAVPALVNLLKAPDSRVRAEAARSLGLLGGEQSVQALLRALRSDTVPAVRKAAALALGLIGGPEVTPALALVLQNPRERTEVRGAAAEALGNVGVVTSAAPLIAALRDPSPEVRFWAAYALGELGVTEAVPALEVVARTDRASLEGWGSVAREAAEAIERISARQTPGQA